MELGCCLVLFGCTNIFHYMDWTKQPCFTSACHTSLFTFHAVCLENKTMVVFFTFFPDIPKPFWEVKGNCWQCEECFRWSPHLSTLTAWLHPALTLFQLLSRAQYCLCLFTGNTMKKLWLLLVKMGRFHLLYSHPSLGYVCASMCWIRFNTLLLDHSLSFQHSILLHTLCLMPKYCTHIFCGSLQSTSLCLGVAMLDLQEELTLSSQDHLSTAMQKTQQLLSGL